VLLSLVCGGCCGASSGQAIEPVPPAPIVVRVREACLTNPPPATQDVRDEDVTPGGEADCPEGYDSCLRFRAVLTLRKQLTAQRRYALDAWDACGLADTIDDDKAHDEEETNAVDDLGNASETGR
jgi:hypothetical protein